MPASIQQRQTISSYASPGKIDARRYDHLSRGEQRDVRNHAESSSGKLAEIEKAGLYKRERIIARPAAAAGLGCGGHAGPQPLRQQLSRTGKSSDVVEAAQQALREWGTA